MSIPAHQPACMAPDARRLPGRRAHLCRGLLAAGRPLAAIAVLATACLGFTISPWQLSAPPRCWLVAGPRAVVPRAAGTARAAGSDEKFMFSDGVARPRSWYDAKAPPPINFDEWPRPLLEENVEDLLQEARYHSYQQLFGYVKDSTDAGISGKIELVEIEGPIVVISLVGKFWHTRTDVVRRIEAFMIENIPEIAEVVVQDLEMLVDKSDGKFFHHKKE